MDLDLDAALQVWEQAMTLPGIEQVATPRWFHGDLMAESGWIAARGPNPRTPANINHLVLARNVCQNHLPRPTPVWLGLATDDRQTA
jgi:hypothetical protein